MKNNAHVFNPSLINYYEPTSYVSSIFSLLSSSFTLIFPYDPFFSPSIGTLSLKQIYICRRPSWPHSTFPESSMYPIDDALCFSTPCRDKSLIQSRGQRIYVWSAVVGLLILCFICEPEKLLATIFTGSIGIINLLSGCFSFKVITFFSFRRDDITGV